MVNNIVLMAGKGQRFTEAGYTQNKALIPVSGKAMIVRAVECMPKADKWAFVVREEHMEETEVIDTLKSVHNDVEVLVDPNPIGQLNSCLVAKPVYHNDEPMFVGACDFGMVWDEKKYQEAWDKGADIISFSFTRHPSLSRNPQAWGWLVQDDDFWIKDVSVKIPISDDPFNDHAITGSFAFKSGKLFQDLADELMKRNIKVKNEFYIDSMLILAIELGYKVLSFPIDNYIGWGVPPDYELYLELEKAFKDPEAHPDTIKDPMYEYYLPYLEKNAK